MPHAPRSRVPITLPILLTVAIIATGCGSATGDDLDLGVAATTTTDASSATRGVDAASTDEGSGQGDDRGQTTPTTMGSGLAPVTTIFVDPGGDPDGIYVGTIGRLGPNEVVVAAAAAPPGSTAHTHPLTGLPGEPIERPAAVVKIDNGPNVATHIGLNAADIVIEEEVEGGVTRLAAIFQSQSSIVGPVRSGRTTDITLVSSLGRPLLLYSGANSITEGILRSYDHIQNHSYASTSGYWRDETRMAPSDLLTDTGPHWAAVQANTPPAQFAYRDHAERAEDGEPAEEVVITYGANRAVWHWRGDHWSRSQRDEPHLLDTGEQVTAANVVIIETERVSTGMTDGLGGVVPEFPFVGTGRAVVYTDGRRIEGLWTRPTLTSVAVLTQGDGEVIELTPGRTWIQLVEADAGMVQ